MGTLVVLDYITNAVLLIKLTSEMLETIEDKYDNDVESWISESDLEAKFGFNMSSAHWMLNENDELEVLFCDAKSGETCRAHMVM